MLDRALSENRDSLRKRMLKGGIIAFSARHATLPCVVRDISETGARLQVEQATRVPDTFELIIELDGLEVACAIVWRRANEIGVAFTSLPVLTAPKRAQVVTSHSAPTNRPTLKRQAVPPAPLAPVAPVVPIAKVAAKQSLNSDSAPPTPKLASPRQTIPILIADDDADDRMLISEAFADSNFQHPITFVGDGEELLVYLRDAAARKRGNLPGLILLDLNMPKMDGRTALMHIKTDPALKRIPVIALTTSDAEEDIQRTYDLGVSAFIPKPNTYNGLTELVRSINDYWLRFVAMPRS